MTLRLLSLIAGAPVKPLQSAVESG